MILNPDQVGDSLPPLGLSPGLGPPTEPRLLSFINEADQTFPMIGYLVPSLETSLVHHHFYKAAKILLFSP